ncbi:MAG: sigma 54-interacting transcriptional regulator, partial [Zoogloeaceae bacterium]|nr:sigma 54-interacting transcriptional regulator [Zoogloeaceae bacterium]
ATLFGYEKGAFTGAQSAQPGKFEQAQAGSLLLDEVTEMPLLLQAKLLRVLQEREVEHVGGKKPIRLDIRVIATSNRDMMAAVQRGTFREDLYYRLNVFPILIPALRQRPADIVPLARHFVREHGAAIGRAGISLSAEAETALTAHPWFGNVRELENTLQRAMILAPGKIIGVESMAMNLASSPSLPARSEEKQQNTEKIADNSNMKDLEREHILKTLAEVHGSRKATAERLGISDRTLRYKLKQYKEEGHLQE